MVQGLADQEPRGLCHPALLTARDALVGMRVRLENEVRGLLKTFGVMFGKRVGGFKRRAEEIISGEPSVAPELVPIFEALIKARRDILARIKALDSQIRTVVRRHKPVQLLMTAPGVGPITALAVFAAFDDAKSLQAIQQRRRLSRPAPSTLRVRRDQPKRRGIETRRQVRQVMPVRGRKRDLLQKPRWITPAGLGPLDRPKNRAAKSQGGSCTQAGRDVARHLAHRLGLQGQPHQLDHQCVQGHCNGVIAEMPAPGR